MKNFIVFAALLFISYGAFSQSSIKVYTDLAEETSMVRVFINDDPLDATHDYQMTSDRLLPGSYELRVSFNSDTIADYVKVVKIKKNEKAVYRVVKMKKFGKDVGKVGRGFGKMAGKTDEDDADDLVQYYRIEKEKK